MMPCARMQLLHPECGMGIRHTHLKCGMDLHCLSNGVNVSLLSLRVPALLPVDHRLVPLRWDIGERGRGFNDKTEEWVIGSMGEEGPELKVTLKPPVVEHTKVAVNFKITSTKIIWKRNKMCIVITNWGYRQLTPNQDAMHVPRSTDKHDCVTWLTNGLCAKWIQHSYTTLWEEKERERS